MEINRKLNLVIPVEVEEGKTIYVHSMPIGAEAFEANYMVLSRAFSDLVRNNMVETSGPQIAAIMVKDIAKKWNSWDGPNGIEASLFTEIRRLTNVVAPTESGWTTIPFDIARKQNLISQDDLAGVENRIVFFTLGRLLPKAVIRAMVTSVWAAWGAQLTLSNVTEFAVGLPTSTETESIGAKATASSIPV